MAEVGLGDLRVTGPGCVGAPVATGRTRVAHAAYDCGASMCPLMAKRRLSKKGVRKRVLLWWPGETEPWGRFS